MNTELTINDETIKKLRYLLGNFNSLKCNIDMYSQYIKKTIVKEKDNNWLFK